MTSATEKMKTKTELRKLLNPGDTVYTVLRHVSSSGMFRRIDVYAPSREIGGAPIKITGQVATLLGYRFSTNDWQRGLGLGVSGCGMDMGFDVVYGLSLALYGAGYRCLGKRKNCPSNYHANCGNRSLEQWCLIHRDGYALRHEWL